MSNWTSPILEVRFDMSAPVLKLFGPNGDPFLSYQGIADENDRLTREADEAELQREQVEGQRKKAELQRTENARKHDFEYQRAEPMAAQLRAMGMEPSE